MPKNEEKQEMAIQYELLRQEVKNIDAQIKELQLRHNELEITSQGIKNLKGNKEREILVPAGSGLYIKSKLTDEQKCLVNIGANVIMEKPVNESIELIDKQIDRIMKTIIKLNEGAKQFINQMMEIEPKIMG